MSMTFVIIDLVIVLSSSFELNMVSPDQITALLDFLEVNPELALGRCTRTKEGRSLAKRLWSECAIILNSISSDSTKKTAEQWRVYYNEYKSKLLKKIKAEKIEIVATGGGLAKNVPFTPLQERLYNILGRDIGEPLPGVRHNPLSQIENEHEPGQGTACHIIPNDVLVVVEELGERTESFDIKWDNLDTYTAEQPVPLDDDHQSEPVQQPQPVQQSDPDVQRSIREPRRKRRRRGTSSQRVTEQEPSMREAAGRLETMERMSADATREHAAATREQAAATNRLAAALEAVAERLRDPIVVVCQKQPRNRGEQL